LSLEDKTATMRPFMKSSFAIWIAAISILPPALLADNWPQWRGPQRDGISHETGLLGEWPKEGPKLLWKMPGVGNGYSTPAVVDGRLFLMASEGLDNEFVEAFDVSNHERIWSTRLGNVGNPKQQPNFPTARSTPTVEGDFLYALSSDGDLACLDTKTGNVRWKKNLRSDFAGKPAAWAYAESPLIDGDSLICAPGGQRGDSDRIEKKHGRPSLEMSAARGR
jgi:outer membrane protein assembly factor BamB